ncbi:putative O-acetyltransferase OatA [Methylocella tundrae]|nr:putative O-acetyltransferase OatA [Methylocella tundrae]
MDHRIKLRGARAEKILMALPNEEKGHVHYIDALRGLAFFLVFWFHASKSIENLPNLLGDILGRGFSGVQLFFVVSALTLFNSMTNRTKNDAAPLRAYFIRRLCRVAPMFWCAIVLYAVVLGFGPRWGAPNGLETHDIAVASLFLHGFDPDALNSVVPGGWSVAVEMQFYLLLPLIFAWARTLKRAVLLFVLSLVIAIAASPAIKGLGAWLLPSEPPGLMSQFAYFSLPTQLPVFFCGIILGLLMGAERAKLRRIEACLPAGPRSRAAIAVALAVLICLPMRWTGRVEMIAGIPGHIGYGVAYALLVYALATFPFKGLVNPFFCYAGKISYSGYLLHIFVIDKAQEFLLGFPQFEALSPQVRLALLGFPALGVTMLLATITYWCVERPGVERGRRFIRKLFGPSLAAPARVAAVA